MSESKTKAARHLNKDLFVFEQKNHDFALSGESPSHMQ